MNIVFLAAIFAVFSITLKAQNSFDENSLIKSLYGMEKRELIAKHIKIDAEKSELFWQLYDEYEIDREDIGTKRTNSIMAYANKYDKLSDSEAESLVKASVEVQLGFIRLWERTYSKMAKSISAVTVAQFIQTEMFLENMVRQELSLEIPMIGEFDMKK
ncbi:MAG TPA: hypothetical protein VK872_09900 [Draconibacterium sp.]|jgi:hypothetical protein|nr:hypothetical protein [Draconibacterium sp.]